MSKPSVGRVVHYQSFGTPGGEYLSAPRAAIITAVEFLDLEVYEEDEEENFRVALCILNPTGQFFNQDVKFSAEPKPGCWNWPPRV